MMVLAAACEERLALLATSQVKGPETLEEEVERFMAELLRFIGASESLELRLQGVECSKEHVTRKTQQSECMSK